MPRIIAVMLVAVLPCAGETGGIAIGLSVTGPKVGRRAQVAEGDASPPPVTGSAASRVRSDGHLGPGRRFPLTLTG
jgi:hypothetical protein